LNQILWGQTSHSHYGSKVPAVTITVFEYRNKIGKIVAPLKRKRKIKRLYKLEWSTYIQIQKMYLDLGRDKY
jgi:hypothetical protein